MLQAMFQQEGAGTVRVKPASAHTSAKQVFEQETVRQKPASPRSDARKVFEQGTGTGTGTGTGVATPGAALLSVSSMFALALSAFFWHVYRHSRAKLFACAS